MANLLTLYLAGVPSSVLPTANKLFTGNAGGPSTTQPTTFLGTAVGFGEIWSSQENDTEWPGLATLPPPSGHGFLLDSSLLVGQDLLAGNYSATVRYVAMQGGSQGGSLTSDLYLRLSKYDVITNAYTPLLVMVSPAQTLNFNLTNYPLSGSMSINTSFRQNEYLYIDYPVNILTNGNGLASQGIRINRLSLDTITFTGDAFAQIITPGYQSSLLPPAGVPLMPGMQNIFRTRFGYAN
jgi:hypothetical protein